MTDSQAYKDVNIIHANGANVKPDRRKYSGFWGSRIKIC